jgi:hypothetical protein
VGDVESSVFDRDPHDGRAALHLLEDVDAALAALKGSAVFDREPQTVDALECLVTAKIAELDEGRVAIGPPIRPIAPYPGLLHK